MTPTHANRHTRKAKTDVEIEKFVKRLKYFTNLERKESYCDVCGWYGHIYGQIQDGPLFPIYDNQKRVIGFDADNINVCEECWNKLNGY